VHPKHTLISEALAQKGYYYGRKSMGKGTKKDVFSEALAQIYYDPGHF